MKLKNKKIIITGAGSGIGRAMVLDAIKRGATVMAVDINQDTLEETKKIAGKKTNIISLHTLDISDRQSVQTFAQKAISEHGEIDGLINNAGIIQPFEKTKDIEYKTIKKVMQVNFYGTLHMTRAFLPHLLKRPEAHIANVSSMGGFLPVPGQGIYGASKAGVKLMTESLYAELINTNINVSIIFPGATNTNITKNSGVEIPKNVNSSNSKNKSMPAEEAAKIILDGLEKNKNRIFVGKDSKIMDILYRLVPSFATRYIAKKMKSLLK